MKEIFAAIFGVVVSLGSVAAAVLVAEDRYASAEEFEVHMAMSRVAELEHRLSRLQQELNYLLRIPEAQRQQWQREQIQYLQNEIRKLQKQIQGTT